MYQKKRKKRLSNPEDALWYPKTFVAIDNKGRPRRYISGNCEVCDIEVRTLWESFSRPKIGYRFRHRKCAHELWATEIDKKARSITPLEIAKRVSRRYARGAEMRGYSWELCLMDVVNLIQKPCFYCSALPSARVGKTIYMGIDRKWNDRGYTVANSAPCCGDCNFLKGNIPYDKWCDFLDRVVGSWHGGR